MLRVATYAFIGQPLRGDRPDKKATPYMLRLLSPNLLRDPELPIGESARPTLRDSGTPAAVAAC